MINAETSSKRRHNVWYDNDYFKLNIMKNSFWIYCFVFVFFVSCNCPAIEPEQEKREEVLLKDSSLNKEILDFIDTLKANGITDNFVLVIKFDSAEFRRESKHLQISMDIYPSIEKTYPIIGGYFPNIDIPIIIIDELNIGKSYYNSIILDTEKIQSFFRESEVIDDEYISFFKSMKIGTITGQSFLVMERNELMHYGTSGIYEKQVT